MRPSWIFSAFGSPHTNSTMVSLSFCAKVAEGNAWCEASPHPYHHPYLPVYDQIFRPQTAVPSTYGSSVLTHSC
jgi:hypothetical protein